MQQVYVVKEIEQLKSLSDTMRMAIIGEAIAKPVTIAQVAEQLNENPRKLYYHFTELERLGLLEVVETRRKRNLVEKSYRAVASFITIDWAIFRQSSEGLDYLVQSVVTMLHQSAVDFQDHFSQGHFNAEQLEAVWPLYVSFSLHPDHLPAFRERMRAVLEEFRDKEPSDDGPNAALTLLFYPFTPAPKPDAPDAPDQD